MRRNSRYLGILLIIIGVLALFATVRGISLISWETMWPLFVLIPGLALELGYFTGERNAGILVPGGILTTIGLLFFFETLTGWRFSGFTWPVYPLSVAIGLFQLYWFGGREWALLIPVVILGGFAGISFASMIFNAVITSRLIGYVFAGMLIILGVYLLVGKKDKWER